MRSWIVVVQKTTEAPPSRAARDLGPQAKSEVIMANDAIFKGLLFHNPKSDFCAGRLDSPYADCIREALRLLPPEEEGNVSKWRLGFGSYWAAYAHARITWY